MVIKARTATSLLYSFAQLGNERPVATLGNPDLWVLCAVYSLVILLVWVNRRWHENKESLHQIMFPHDHVPTPAGYSEHFSTASPSVPGPCPFKQSQLTWRPYLHQSPRPPGFWAKDSVPSVALYFEHLGRPLEVVVFLLTSK